MTRARTALAAAVLAGATLLQSGNSAAVIRRHDVASDRYLVAAEDYPEVVDFGGVGATVISPEWIVTAAHTVEELDLQPLVPWEVTIGGVTHRYDKIVIHPRRQRGSVNSDFDIALIHLVTPTAVTPAPLYEWGDESGRPVEIVGRGATGVGTDQTEGLTRDGSLRRATNVVDGVFAHSLVTVFNAPPSGGELEGTPGPGDSGSPLYITRDGVRYLAGVSSYNAHDRSSHMYGSMHAYSRVSAWREWMAEVMAGGVTSSIRPWTPWRAGSAGLTPSAATTTVTALLRALSSEGVDSLQDFYRQYGSTTSPNPPEVRAARLRETMPQTRYEVVASTESSPHDVAILVREVETGRLVCILISLAPDGDRRMRGLGLTLTDTLPAIT